jgi:hypothetical protein
MRKTAARSVNTPQNVRAWPRSRQPVFLDVDGRGLADVAQQIRVGFVERLSGAADDAVNGAARELGAEELAQQLDGVAAGDTVTDGEGGHGRLQARPESSPGNVGRQLCSCGTAALRAAQALQAVLVEEDRDRGQLRDLVAGGLPDGVALRLAEAVAAAAARGPVLDELMDGFEGRQMTTTSRVARLGALATLRGRRPPALRRPGRILAGGRRGVARVAAEALLEFRDARRQLGDLLILPGDLRRQRQEHSHDGLAALLVDRLRLGAFHAQGVRGAGASACRCSRSRLLRALGWTD